MTTIDCSTLNKETLAHLVLINQMAAATGCTHEHAKQLLVLTEWRLDSAINLFFDERTMPIPCCKFSERMTPTNTPATPPNFPETLLSFNKLSTSPLPMNHVSNENQLPPPPSTATATTHSLSSSPMNIMMMDGTT